MRPDQFLKAITEWVGKTIAVATRDGVMFVRTPKGWYQAKFRCSRLQGIERDVLRAAFTITGRNGRLFAVHEDTDTWGWASALDIAALLGKDPTEKNLIKIRAVLKFLKSLTWIQTEYRAKANSRTGATRILVSRSCYRLRKWVSDSALKIRAIYKNSIWGSGGDSEVKDSKPFERLAPDGWEPPDQMARWSPLAVGFSQ